MLFNTEKQNKKQLFELFGQVLYTVIIICCTWIISSECRAECEKYDQTTAAECSEDDETLSKRKRKRKLLEDFVTGWFRTIFLNDINEYVCFFSKYTHWSQFTDKDGRICTLCSVRSYTRCYDNRMISKAPKRDNEVKELREIFTSGR